MSAESLRLMIPEALRALRGHLLERRGVLSREFVRGYFESRSGRRPDQFTDVIESSSALYRRLLTTSEVWNLLKSLGPGDTVLDFGCGRAALLRLIRDHNRAVHYVGFDIDRVGIRNLRRTNEDSSAEFHDELPRLRAQVTFAINVLAYTSDFEAAAVVDAMVSSLHSTGLLVVIEPVPAWYWETKFDGIEVRLRSCSEVDQLVGRCNRNLRNEVVLAITQIGRVPVVPISWLGVWS